MAKSTNVMQDVFDSNAHILTGALAGDDLHGPTPFLKAENAVEKFLNERLGIQSKVSISFVSAAERYVKVTVHDETPAKTEMVTQWPSFSCEMYV